MTALDCFCFSSIVKLSSVTFICFLTAAFAAFKELILTKFKSLKSGKTMYYKGFVELTLGNKLIRNLAKRKVDTKRKSFKL